MNPNVGKIDRIVRAALGVGFFALAILQANLWSILWGLLGGCFLLSASFGWCSLYSVCGISSCSVRPPSSETPPKP